MGYEASFSLAPGNYTIVVRVEALGANGAATAGFVGFNTHATSAVSTSILSILRRDNGVALILAPRAPVRTRD
jgi:hypothetical protein